MSKTVFSPLRLEQARKLEKKKKFQQLLEELPVLTREDIIRYRLPLYEAIIRKLEISGHPSTADYMTQLVEYQQSMRIASGPDTIIWLRPELIKCPNILEKLQVCLQKAEDAHIAGRIGEEVDELMKLGVEYGFGSDDWWWLGNQLLHQCVEASCNYENDMGKRHALARYLYGKFLLENMSDVENGTTHLNIARKISDGMSWNVKVVFPDVSATIFAEVSILLHKILLAEARSLMRTDMTNALRYCELSRRRAMNGCYRIGETHAILAKGECEMSLNNVAAAILTFKKALKIQEEHETVDELCEVRVHLAVAYLRKGMLNEALEQLQLLRDYAETNDRPTYVAKAFKYLGEYYLNAGAPSSSTPLLIIALKLFYEQHNAPEREATRQLAAISIGIELMKQYECLVLDSGQCFSYMMKLIKWKDDREVFWETTDRPAIGDDEKVEFKRELFSSVREEQAEKSKHGSQIMFDIKSLASDQLPDNPSLVDTISTASSSHSEDVQYHVPTPSAATDDDSSM